MSNAEFKIHRSPDDTAGIPKTEEQLKAAFEADMENAARDAAADVTTHTEHLTEAEKETKVAGVIQEKLDILRENVADMKDAIATRRDEATAKVNLLRKQALQYLVSSANRLIELDHKVVRLIPEGVELILIGALAEYDVSPEKALLLAELVNHFITVRVQNKADKALDQLATLVAMLGGDEHAQELKDQLVDGINAAREAGKAEAEAAADGGGAQTPPPPPPPGGKGPDGPNDKVPEEGDEGFMGPVRPEVREQKERERRAAQIEAFKKKYLPFYSAVSEIEFNSGVEDQARQLAYEILKRDQAGVEPTETQLYEKIEEILQNERDQDFLIDGLIPMMNTIEAASQNPKDFDMYKKLAVANFKEIIGDRDVLEKYNREGVNKLLRTVQRILGIKEEGIGSTEDDAYRLTDEEFIKQFDIEPLDQRSLLNEENFFIEAVPTNRGKYETLVQAAEKRLKYRRKGTGPKYQYEFYVMYDVRDVLSMPQDIQDRLESRSIVAKIIKNQALPGIDTATYRLLRTLDDVGVNTMEGEQGRFEAYFQGILDSMLSSPEISRQKALIARYKEWAESTEDPRNASRLISEAEARLKSLQDEAESAAFQSYRNSILGVAKEFIWSKAGQGADNEYVKDIRRSLGSINTRLNITTFGEKRAFLREPFIAQDPELLRDIAETTGSPIIALGREYVIYKHSPAMLKHGFGELNATIGRYADIVDSVTNAEKAISAGDGPDTFKKEASNINRDNIVWFMHEEGILAESLELSRVGFAIERTLNNRILPTHYGFLRQAGSLTPDNEYAFSGQFALTNTERQARYEDVEVENIYVEEIDGKRIESPVVPNGEKYIRLRVPIGKTDVERQEYIEEQKKRKKRGIATEEELEQERHKTVVNRMSRVARGLRLLYNGDDLASLLSSFHAAMIAAKLDKETGKLTKDYHYASEQGASGVVKLLEQLSPAAQDIRYGRDRDNGQALWYVETPRMLDDLEPLAKRGNPSHADAYRRMEETEQAILNGASGWYLDRTREYVTLMELSTKPLAPLDRLAGPRTDQMNFIVRGLARQVEATYGTDLPRDTMKWHEYMMGRLLYIGGPRWVEQYIENNIDSMMKADRLGKIDRTELNEKEARRCMIKLDDNEVFNTEELRNIRARFLRGDQTLSYPDLQLLKDRLDKYVAVRTYGDREKAQKYYYAFALNENIARHMKVIHRDAKKRYYTRYIFDEIREHFPTHMMLLQDRQFTPNDESLISDDVVKHIFDAIKQYEEGINRPMADRITSKASARDYIQNSLAPMFMMGSYLYEARAWKRRRAEIDAQFRADQAARRANRAPGRAPEILVSTLDRVDDRDLSRVKVLVPHEDAEFDQVLDNMYGRFIVAMGMISPAENRADALVHPDTQSFDSLPKSVFKDIFAAYYTDGLSTSVQKSRLNRPAGYMNAKSEDLAERYGELMAYGIGSLSVELSNIMANDLLESSGGSPTQSNFVNNFDTVKANAAGFQKLTGAVKGIVRSGNADQSKEAAKKAAGQLAEGVNAITESMNSWPDQKREYAMRLDLSAAQLIARPVEFRGLNGDQQMMKWIRNGGKASIFGSTVPSKGIYSADRAALAVIMQTLAEETGIPQASHSVESSEGAEEVIRSGKLRGRVAAILNPDAAARVKAEDDAAAARAAATAVVTPPDPNAPPPTIRERLSIRVHKAKKAVRESLDSGVTSILRSVASSAVGRDLLHSQFASLVGPLPKTYKREDFFMGQMMRYVGATKDEMLKPELVWKIIPGIIIGMLLATAGAAVADFLREAK